jgi:hypothetical protein
MPENGKLYRVRRLIVGSLFFASLQAITDMRIAASEPQAEASTGVRNDKDRDPEIDAAIARLRDLGAFVREFHHRKHPQYWVQIISTGLGSTTRKHAPNFNDDSLGDVEIIGRGVELQLHLRKTAVTGEGLRRLASVGRLSMLELSGNNVGEAMLEVLPELPLQGQLALESDLLTDDDLLYVAQCKKLTSVSLHGTRLTNDGLEVLAGLPKLEGISLGANFSFVAFPILARFENLRDLEVTWQATPLLADLAKIPKLRRLTLSGKENDDETALTIADSFKFLEQAYLRGTSITNEGVAHLSQINSLKVLTLDRAPIDDRAADSFRKMRQLEWLSLDECQVGDATLAAISECPNLWHLNLGRSLITDDGLVALSRLKKLHVVYLWSCKTVTDEGIKSLMRLPAAEGHGLHLNIQNSGVTEPAARKLQAALPHAEIMWGVPPKQLR